MLGRLARELPVGGYVYEPKWDGFRCLAFRDGDEVDLRSRHDRPLARYFPELAAALRSLKESRVVLDGEIVIATTAGFDFEALLGRVHPAASRVERLARETPATLIVFDLLALGDEDLRERPFAERRHRLEELLEPAGGTLRLARPAADAKEGSLDGPLRLTPATAEATIARGWLERYQGGGIDGVIAKREDLPYRPGARAMVKVKQERTADCVVAGFRWFVDRPLPSSLLLGLYDGEGSLRHIGVVTSFTEERRRQLIDELRPHAVALHGHPWEHGFLMAGSPVGRLAGAAGRWSPRMELDWVPLAPALVCEVAHDQVDGDRLRHPARFRRWRPDREPASCLLDQLGR